MTICALTARSAARAFAAAMLLVFCVVCAGRASADESALAEMDHKSWTARDGAPQGVTALAQAPDGILWIGTESGLFNFDGRTFNSFQPQPGEPDLPAGQVRSILATREGAIWVGFHYGGVARIQQGRVKLFTQAGRLELTRIDHLQQSSDGALWAIQRQQNLIRFGVDGNWRLQPSPLGDSGGEIHDIFIDSSDTLWLAQGGRLYRRPLNQSKYFVTQARADWMFGVSEAPDHSLWVNDSITDAPGHPTGRTQHVDRYGNVLVQLPDTDNLAGLLYAPDGSLFTIPYDNGITRIPTQALAEPASLAKDGVEEEYHQKDGLSSESMASMLLDADGNLWTGGKKGLDRFRKARLVPYILKYGVSDVHLCAGKSGDVWIASGGSEEQLYKVSGEITKYFPEKSQIYSMFCAPDGDIWMLSNNGVFNIHDGRTESILSIPGTHAFSTLQIVASADRTLFASVAGGPDEIGIWRYAHNNWVKLTGAGIPPSAPTTEYIDSRGRLWTGYSDGQIGLPLQGHGRSLSSGNPGLGVIFVMLETAHGLFAGGMNGIAVLRDNRVEMLNFSDTISSRGVGGLVESANGDLWLNTLRGIVHIPASELQEALASPQHKMKSELLTEGDFAGPIELGPGRGPLAARDAKGRLWFATMNGVFHIDPEQGSSTARPPILSIKSVLADGTPLDVDGNIGPGVRTLDVQYHGVNLTAPEKLIYRYRLDGLDDSWQDAGHRTVALYPHLPPGTYTFRVEASNDGNSWTQPVSSASIVVLPSFYQTKWFLALCGILVLAAIWFLVTLRIRAVTREIRARAEERADERIRISRELHDTLLQSVQGLLLTFHVAAQKVSPDDESRKLLDTALSTADRVIIEGRNRVNSLRSEHLTDAELVGSLENVGADLRRDDRIEFRVVRKGIDATLHAHIADEVFYIAREALTNAFRHSGASRITLDLIYGVRFFSMSCVDNGRGFDSNDKEKAGHWGLTGMIERAENLGGQLRWRSKPANGAEILFTLPSYRAYKNYSRLTFYLRAFQLSERDPTNL